MQQDNRLALLLVNSNSRSGGEYDFNEIILYLKAGKIKVILQHTANAQESGDAISKYQDKIDLVIVAGGDGTIRSCLAALHKSKTPLAILPLGTANDLARSLGIPQDPFVACQAIIDNHRKRINLAIVNGQYFVNAANIGLGVIVNRLMKRQLKKSWGVLSYLKALFEAMSRKRRFKVCIDVDNRQYRISSTQIAIGNGRFYGGGNIIEESSTIDDGLLWLYSLPSEKVWHLLTLAPLLRVGKQRLAKMVLSTSGQHIIIKTENSMEITADGEPVSYTPAEFEIIPEALEVILPDPGLAIDSMFKIKE